MFSPVTLVPSTVTATQQNAEWVFIRGLIFVFITLLKKILTASGLLLLFCFKYAAEFHWLNMDTCILEEKSEFVKGNL